jgi:hypothetical protein
MLDLPAPVLPTIPTFSPACIRSDLIGQLSQPIVLNVKEVGRNSQVLQNRCQSFSVIHDDIIELNLPLARPADRRLGCLDDMRLLLNQRITAVMQNPFDRIHVVLDLMAILRDISFDSFLDSILASSVNIPLLIAW